MSIKFGDSSIKADIDSTRLNAEINADAIRVSFNAPLLKPSSGSQIIRSPVYGGSYEVTPSDVQQVLATSGKNLSADVVINPIPNNYGHISWDGTVITVS